MSRVKSDSIFFSLQKLIQERSYHSYGNLYIALLGATW